MARICYTADDAWPFAISWLEPKTCSPVATALVNQLKTARRRGSMELAGLFLPYFQVLLACLSPNRYRVPLQRTPLLLRARR
jgi:hypothetical protein